MLWEGCPLGLGFLSLGCPEAPWGTDWPPAAPRCHPVSPHGLCCSQVAFLETHLRPALRPPGSETLRGRKVGDPLCAVAPSVSEVEHIYSFVPGHLLSRASRDKSHPTRAEPTAGREVCRFSGSETPGEVPEPPAWETGPAVLQRD